MGQLEKSSPSQAGTLRNILAGGTWPQTRVAEVSPDTVLTCPHCQEVPEDEYHRWYICGSHNGCRKDHKLIRTQAQNELNRCDPITKEVTPLRQHLWLRGLPQEIDVGKPLDEDSSPTEVFTQPVKAYTDGGAAHPEDHRRRRSGWGIWVEQGHALNSHGVVPGAEQSAGRAELYAAVKVLERTTSGVYLIIDNKACVHNMMALIDGRLVPHGKHADLHRRAIKAFENIPAR
eukprot:4840603-Heterocapsa_arctica.AAC.1